MTTTYEGFDFSLPASLPPLGDTTTYTQEQEQELVPAASLVAPEEPLYVNARQYHRILKRRVQRAKLEMLETTKQQKQPYKHESRHNHAVRRPRGTGGRFLTAKEKQELRELELAEKEKSGFSPGFNSDDSPLSSSSENTTPPLPSHHSRPPLPTPHAIAPFYPLTSNPVGGEKRKRLSQPVPNTSRFNSVLTQLPNPQHFQPPANFPNTQVNPLSTFDELTSFPTIEINQHFTQNTDLPSTPPTNIRPFDPGFSPTVIPSIPTSHPNNFASYALVSLSVFPLGCLDSLMLRRYNGQNNTLSHRYRCACNLLLNVYSMIALSRSIPVPGLHRLLKFNC